MPTANLNIGTNTRVVLYLAGKKIARDFTKMRSFQSKPEFDQGSDELISGTFLWSEYLKSSGSFVIDEENASHVGLFNKAIKDGASRAAGGGRPDVVLVVHTTNNDGTSTKVTFTDVSLSWTYDAPGKGLKNFYTYTFVGIDEDAD